MSVETWTVDIQTDVDDGEIRATARLRELTPGTLVGHGRARVYPADPQIARPGKALATGRALADLGRRLMDAAATTAERDRQQPKRLLW